MPILKGKIPYSSLLLSFESVIFKGIEKLLERAF